MLGPILGSGKARGILGGQWMGHAVHPLLTHVPIGVWTSSLILDFAGGKSSEDAADLLLGVGLAAFAPTALTGWSDWCRASREQQRVGLVHAAANATAAGLFARSRLVRRQGRRGHGKLLSVLGASVLSLGGYLGGHLAYARGVGVERRPPHQT